MELTGKPKTFSVFAPDEQLRGNEWAAMLDPGAPVDSCCNEESVDFLFKGAKSFKTPLDVMWAFTSKVCC